MNSLTPITPIPYTVQYCRPNGCRDNIWGFSGVSPQFRERHGGQISYLAFIEDKSIDQTNFSTVTEMQ